MKAEIKLAPGAGEKLLRAAKEAGIEIGVQPARAIVKLLERPMSFEEWDFALQVGNDLAESMGEKDWRLEAPGVVCGEPGCDCAGGGNGTDAWTLPLGATIRRKVSLRFRRGGIREEHGWTTIELSGGSVFFPLESYWLLSESFASVSPAGRLRAVLRGLGISVSRNAR